MFCDRANPLSCTCEPTPAATLTSTDFGCVIPTVYTGSGPFRSATRRPTFRYYSSGAYTYDGKPFGRRGQAVIVRQATVKSRTAGRAASHVVSARTAAPPTRHPAQSSSTHRRPPLSLAAAVYNTCRDGKVRGTIHAGRVGARASLGAVRVGTHRFLNWRVSVAYSEGRLWSLSPLNSQNYHQEI